MESLGQRLHKRPSGLYGKLGEALKMQPRDSDSGWRLWSLEGNEVHGI